MFVAEVEFWGEDKGGRFTPPQSGFRPQIKVGDVYTSCIVTSMEKPDSVFEFNKPYLVKLELVFSEEYENKLNPNDGVCLFEGSKQIAQGRITKPI